MLNTKVLYAQSHIYIWIYIYIIYWAYMPIYIYGKQGQLQPWKTAVSGCISVQHPEVLGSTSNRFFVTKQWLFCNSPVKLKIGPEPQSGFI